MASVAAIRDKFQEQAKGRVSPHSQRQQHLQQAKGRVSPCNQQQRHNGGETHQGYPKSIQYTSGTTISGRKESGELFTGGNNCSKVQIQRNLYSGSSSGTSSNRTSSGSTVSLNSKALPSLQTVLSRSSGINQDESNRSASLTNVFDLAKPSGHIADNGQIRSKSGSTGLLVGFHDDDDIDPTTHQERLSVVSEMKSKFEMTALIPSTLPRKMKGQTLEQMSATEQFSSLLKRDGAKVLSNGSNFGVSVKPSLMPKPISTCNNSQLDNNINTHNSIDLLTIDRDVCSNGAKENEPVKWNPVNNTKLVPRLGPDQWSSVRHDHGQHSSVDFNDTRPASNTNWINQTMTMADPKPVEINTNTNWNFIRRQLPSENELGPPPPKPTKLPDVKCVGHLNTFPRASVAFDIESALQKQRRPPPMPPNPDDSSRKPLPPPPLDNEEFYDDNLTSTNTMQGLSHQRSITPMKEPFLSPGLHHQTLDQSKLTNKLPTIISPMYNENTASYELYQDTSIDEEIDDMYEEMGVGSCSDYGSTTANQQNLKKTKDEEKKLKQEQKEKEKQEKAMTKLKEKFKLTGQETRLETGKVKKTVKGRNLDLSLKEGETVSIIRMEDNPRGKWLVENDYGRIGYVELDNIEMDPDSIRSVMVSSYSSLAFTHNHIQYRQDEDEDIYQDISIMEDFPRH